MRLRHLASPILIVALSSLMLTYCGKSEEKKVEPNFTSLYDNVFKDCASCHQPGKETYETKVQDLDLSSKQNAYTSLLKTSTLSGCTSLKYVSAGNHKVSIVAAVLDSTIRDSFQTETGTTCGVLAPADHGISEYSAEAVAAVKTWIDAGAKND